MDSMYTSILSYRNSSKTWLCVLAAVLFCMIGSSSDAETAIGQNAVYVQSAVDSEGNLHIVYMSQGWAGSCYYMKYNGSTWVGPTYLPNSYPSWKPFTYARIDVGPDGRAQVIYGVRTGDYPDDLLYLWYAKADDADGTSFSVQQLGDDGFRRGSYDIAVDESNQPHICYGKTNKYEPYWWNIIYRRTDGTEKVIDTGVDGSRVLKPAIAFENGLVHLTWYKQSPGTTNIRYAVDTPYGDDFPIEQLTNNSSGHQVESPDIATAPDGHAEIVYFAADWTGAEPHYEGLWLVLPGSAPVMLEPTYAGIDEYNEDFPPNIRIDNDSDRYVVWSHYTWGESLYKINWEDKVGLSPWGNIAIGAGNGAYYVRTHGCPGPLYFDQLDPGGPTFYPPTAQIDGIAPSPLQRGFHFSVSFTGSAWDNDEGGSSITAWEWYSNHNGVIGATEDVVLDPIVLDVGRHTISFKAQDNEGEWSNQVTTFLMVSADTVAPPPVDVITITPTQGDTAVVAWQGVVDNLAMDYYEIYRDSYPWFVPDQPIAQVDAATMPLSYEDGDAFSQDDQAYYLVVPVDVDGNVNMAGLRAGAYRYQLEDGETR